ncbi:mitosis inhibitor kinase SWE1 [Ceratobasidium sp. AG-Ba]|nr:mitosis inhibitor kinase SWE1 [Ceratobasidium sp. AG-Ba]
MLASTPPPCLRTPRTSQHTTHSPAHPAPATHQRTTHNPYRRPPMSPLRAVSTPTPGTPSGIDTPMHSPSPLRQRIMLDQPRFPRVVHRPAFPSLSPRRPQLDSAQAVSTPTNSSFPPRRPLTRLCSDTTFAQPLVPSSDSDSDGSDLELDLDGDSVIRDIGIDHDVEIHDVDPDEVQDVSILQDDDDDEAEQSWHTAPPFTPGLSGAFSRSDDHPSRSNLTRTPSTRPTALIPDDMQPPKAKRRSLDFATAASTMPKFLLTPSRTRHREPAPERSSPPETCSPASPTARKHRLGLPLPRTPGPENQTWHGGIDVNSESIRKLSLIDDEYNLGSDSDSPSNLFPSTTKGKSRTREHTWDPSSHKLKGTRRATAGIFADPAAGTIPIAEQVPSADPTSPFVLQTAASNAPKDFVAPAFSLSTFSPPRTSSPFKTRPGRKGGLFENEMSFGLGGDEMGEMENEMFPPIATSSPDPKRFAKRAPLASVPRLNVDGPPQAGHVTFSGVSSLLSGPLKKKYKARDSSVIGDESILEEGPELSGKPHTRARTMSFPRGSRPNVNLNFNLPKSDDDLVTPQLGPAMASAWPDASNSDDQDLDDEIFKSMVSHTSFSVEATGAGGGGSGMPDTPVKKAVFGGGGASVGGGPIAMGGARGWMTSLPDRGGKAFGGRNAPRPSLPIHFPELTPDSPDESPAAGRSKLHTIDSNESPTTRPFWTGADESPSLRPRRKSSETSGIGRRKSAGGDISLNLGVRKQKAVDSPGRPPLGPQRRSYGSLGLGRPGGRERDPIPKFSFDENQENELGLSTGEENTKPGRSLTSSTSANSFLAPSNSLGVMPFMRRASSGTFSSDGEASVSGTPTRRGAAAMRGGLGGHPRPVQPVGARLAPGPSTRPAVPGRSSLPVANWRLVTPSPSLSSLASIDTPSAPARKVARASPILSKGKRASVPVPAFHSPAVAEPEPTVTLGRLEREYTTVQQIGKGTFGQVLKVEKDGRLFAVKRSKVFEGVRHRRRVLEEVDILRHLATGGGHSNVLKFEDAWEQDGRSLILTEMCELGNLADFLVEWGERFARLDEPRVWKIASDLSHGLAFIHAAGVIHLDLKPANMFVTIEGRIRIGDFGMAARWPRPEVDSDGFEREGDRDYMAPEILQGAYGFAADVFSLGMTLLECTTNIIVPAMGEPWHKLRNDDFSDVDLEGFSPELISIISSMMRRDASQRPSMSLVCAHECIVRTESIMTRAIEQARASSTNVFRASPFGSEGPAFLEEVLGRGQMDMS